MMPHPNLPQLIRFLKREFLLSPDQIQVGLKQSQRNQGPLVMVLWQYGFITLEQLDQAQQWLLQRQSATFTKG